jgi:inosine-uridine nucleoside N-ribohydrolase
MSNPNLTQELCWLDCDPGHDDAFAIILAAYSEKIKLLGISTVAGNQTIEKTTENALKCMNLYGLIREPTIKQHSLDQEPSASSVRLEDSMTHGGMSCPLLKGCSRPIFRDPIVCEEIFGDSGLDTHSPDIEFPPVPSTARAYVNKLNAQQCVHFTTQMYNYFKAQRPRKVTLMAIGPLTNIALLLLNHPDVTEYIDRLILMGGNVTAGNVTPTAEYNVYSDPHAASIVFNSNMTARIYMVPLDVTNQALVTESVIERIRAISSNFSHIMVDLLHFIISSTKEMSGKEDTPLHDPCAIAYLIDPSLFVFKLIRVDVEVTGAFTFGKTICDIQSRPSSNVKKNVHVCVRMDVDKFWSIMIEFIKRADKHSPANLKK